MNSKGRIKESAGALTGNKRLWISGRTNQTTGKVKEAARQVMTKAKVAAKVAVSHAKEAGRRNVDKAAKAAKTLRD